jgi:hypothetical protein
MSAFTGAALRAGRAGRGLLPTGQLLTPEVWARRHRGVVWLPFGLALGYVVVHHSALGVLNAAGVFNHPAALRVPS